MRGRGLGMPGSTSPVARQNSMIRRLTFALGLLLALLAAVPAGAASVAYIDNYNLWVSSPDGSQKFQMTQGGNADASWNFPCTLWIRHCFIRTILVSPMMKPLRGSRRFSSMLVARGACSQ